MSMALLRAPIYLLAHGQFYDACGPNESITNERSALRAFRSTRIFGCILFKTTKKVRNYVFSLVCENHIETICKRMDILAKEPLGTLQMAQVISLRSFHTRNLRYSHLK